MSRKCPRTGAPLKPLKLGGVTVDFSDQCGGVFFDRFELERFDDDVEFRGDYLAEMMAQANDPSLDYSARIKCPNCPDVVMMRRAYSALKKVVLDECPACAGIWLDAGELATLRRELPNEAARKQVSEKFVEEIMSSSEVERHEKALTAYQARGARIAQRLWRLMGIR